MKHAEDQLQAECVRYFRYQYPNVVLFAIPNGGKRNAIEAARMKGTGTLAGVADLFVMMPKFEQPEKVEQISMSEFYAQLDVHYGLFIELKTAKGKQTDHQKAFQEAAIQAGYAYEVCRSFDEFKTIVDKYLKP